MHPWEIGGIESREWRNPRTRVCNAGKNIYFFLAAWSFAFWMPIVGARGRAVSLQATAPARTCEKNKKSLTPWFSALRMPIMGVRERGSALRLTPAPHEKIFFTPWFSALRMPIMSVRETTQTPNQQEKPQ